MTHEEALAPERLVRTLNWALLDAHIVDNLKGGSLLNRGKRNWTTYMLLACGILWGISLGTWKRVARDPEQPWFEDPFTYFALACIAVGGPLLFLRALRGVFVERHLNMFMTMALAVVGALILRDFFEAAAIVFFFVLSEWVQKWCVHHTAEQAGGLGELSTSMQRVAFGSATGSPPVPPAAATVGHGWLRVAAPHSRAASVLPRSRPAHHWRVQRPRS